MHGLRLRQFFSDSLRFGVCRFSLFVTLSFEEMCWGKTGFGLPSVEFVLPVVFCEDGLLRAARLAFNSFRRAGQPQRSPRAVRRFVQRRNPFSDVGWRFGLFSQVRLVSD